MSRRGPFRPWRSMPHLGRHRVVVYGTYKVLGNSIGSVAKWRRFRSHQHLSRPSNSNLNILRPAGGSVPWPAGSPAKTRAGRTLATLPVWPVAMPIGLDPRQADLIRVSAKGHATLTISDSGIGISKEFLPRFFEPFAQGNPTFGPQPGSLGLGLSLTRHLIEMLGRESRSREPVTSGLDVRFSLAP